MTGSAFQEYLGELRTVVDAALKAELDRAGWPESLKKAVQYSLMAGGKRLRPILVLLANEVCGGKRDDALPAACAIEMVHTYSLVHDDLPSMDDDDFRRGRPACHKVFGEALATLAGDCLLTQAFETIASAGVDAGRIKELIRILATAAGGGGMVGGQVLDLEAERGRFAVAESGDRNTESRNSCCDEPVNAVRNDDGAESRTVADSAETSSTSPTRSPNFRENVSNQTTDSRVEELTQIHRMKTGALIAASLELGAISAMAEPEHCIRLRRYGYSIGLAFQITDDLLDVMGDQTRLGKTPGRDVDLGKLTYPSLLGIEPSRARAYQLIQDARDAVDAFGNRSVWLKELAGFIVERDH